MAVNEPGRQKELSSASEEPFRALCASSPIGIFLTGPDGRCTYTNPRCQTICDVTFEESLGEGWLRWVHPEDRTWVLKEWYADKHLAREFSREFRFQTAGGLVSWVHVRSAPMFSGEGGLTGHVGTVEDITERKRAEETLRESESRYRMLIEQASDGIHTYDLEGNFLEVNTRLCEMLGYTREELLKLNVHDLVPTEELSLTPIRFDELRAGKTLISERQVRRKDGTLLSAEISGKMLKEGVLQAFIRDITARKQAEAALQQAHDELERRVEERTTELAKTNEALQAEITERRQADEARMELLRKIVNTQEDERRRLALELHDQMGQDITAMILGLKSLENSYGEGKLDLHHLGQLQELTDQLERKVHNLAWELRPSALDDLGLSTALFNYMEEWSGRYRIEIDFHSIGLEDERLPPHVATTIYRIVQEALTNIAKHAEADCVSLVLVKRHENVSAIIEDNGKGFDMQAVMAAPIKERRLGLLGMRERVELVGGTLSIESAPGGGTTLFARIPVPDEQNGVDQRE